LYPDAEWVCKTNLCTHRDLELSIVIANLFGKSIIALWDGLFFREPLKTQNAFSRKDAKKRKITKTLRLDVLARNKKLVIRDAQLIESINKAWRDLYEDITG